MREALNGTQAEAKEGKGLSTVVGWTDDMPKDARPRLLGITYRPKSRAPGFLLNMCPWCGAPLKFWPEPKPAA
jgi:hypothetical protein